MHLDRDTPFNLAFEMDTVIQVDVGINMFRVKHFDLEQNEENVRANLNLLEEAREEASVKVTTKHDIS